MYEFAGGPPAGRAGVGGERAPVTLGEIDHQVVAVAARATRQADLSPDPPRRGQGLSIDEGNHPKMRKTPFQCRENGRRQQHIAQLV